MEKKEIVNQLRDTIMAQKNLDRREKIMDLIWALADRPDNYSIEAEVQEMIREERVRQGLSQVKLAKRAGLCSNRVCDFDNGKRVPTLHTLQMIAHGLGMRLTVSLEPNPELEAEV